jgi:hypothetical protein
MLVFMFRASFQFYFSVFSLTFAGFFFAFGLGFPARPLAADDEVVWSDQEKPIFEQLRGLQASMRQMVHTFCRPLSPCVI